MSGLGAPASGARGLRCAHRGPRQGLADRDYIAAAASNGSGNRDERGNSESSSLNTPLKTELMTLRDFPRPRGGPGTGLHIYYRHSVFKHRHPESRVLGPRVASFLPWPSPTPHCPHVTPSQCCL